LNILVAVKHVIDVELNLRVREGKLVEEGLNYVLSKWDENALEAALQLKEAGSGPDESTVTAVTIGSERAGESLRKALAMGADKGVHVSDDAAAGSDSLGYARILAKVAERGGYDLIITGRQSQDTDMGGTGPMLAGMLGMPFVANVVKIEPAGDGKLTVHRNGDAGREVAEVTLPALLTANDSLNEPRLASLRGIMAAKKKPLETLTLADLGVDTGSVGAAGARVGISEFLPPKARQAGQKFEGDAEEITRKVVDLLVNEAKVFG
jgi:electron transfer flavoprotein beta subunit